MTKQEIQQQINKLQKELDKCPDVEPFEAKGKWVIHYDGWCTKGDVGSKFVKEHFNYWKTRKQAEQASEAQRKWNMITNYISQFDGELGLDNYFIYYSNSSKCWRHTYTSGIDLGVHLMSRECSVALAEDLNNGIVKL